MRESIHAYLMKMAQQAATRSTCTSNHATGAVAAKDGRVIMTAYNGVPSGVKHCDDGGCVRLADGKHAYLLHAEENLVAQAARFQISLDQAMVYVTHHPCSHCAAILMQAGVQTIIYLYPTATTEEFFAVKELAHGPGILEVLWLSAVLDEERRQE